LLPYSLSINYTCVRKTVYCNEELTLLKCSCNDRRLR
jgi:hypothetical protein